MAYARSNPHRFTTTRAGKSEIDEEFNTQTGWINEASRRMDNIETSGISGANNPANAGKVPVTDGYQISWKKVDLSYLTPNSMNDTIFQDRSVTNRVMGVHSIGSDQLMDGCVNERKVPHNSLPGTKIIDNSIPLSKLPLPPGNCVMVGTGFGYQPCDLDPWTVPTVAFINNGVKNKPLDVIFNNSEANFDGRKLQNKSVEWSKLVDEVRQALLPTGSIVSYAGTGLDWNNDPPGFLSCNGRYILISAAPKLYSVIGGQYNDPHTPHGQFCLPDLRGRAIFGICSDPTGQGDVGGRITTEVSSGINIGAGGGSEQVTLTVDQLPPHQHTYNAPRAGFLSGGSRLAISTDNSTFTGSTGSGAAHNNMPPFVLLNWLIKI